MDGWIVIRGYTSKVCVSIYIYMGASSFPHPYISASSVVRPIQYSAKDVLTLVMPHTAKCGINPYISIHMTEIRYIHGPDCIKYEHV